MRSPYIISLILTIFAVTGCGDVGSRGASSPEPGGQAARKPVEFILPNVNLVSRGKQYILVQVPESVTQDGVRLMSADGVQFDLFMGLNEPLDEDDRDGSAQVMRSLEAGTPLEGTEEVVAIGRWLGGCRDDVSPTGTIRECWFYSKDEHLRIRAHGWQDSGRRVLEAIVTTARQID
jgi:hypothetical protein